LRTASLCRRPPSDDGSRNAAVDAEILARNPAGRVGGWKRGEIALWGRPNHFIRVAPVRWNCNYFHNPRKYSRTGFDFIRTFFQSPSFMNTTLKRFWLGLATVLIFPLARDGLIAASFTDLTQPPNAVEVRGGRG
jgi:hypothetical protein